MSTNDLFILLTGVLVVIPTSLLGSFLLLRGWSMLGDAISHGVLPGIVLAFLISGTRNPLWVLSGASLLGVITAYTAQWLERQMGVQSDASIGVSFTTFFALGIILVSAYTAQVDLDQACVLYGEMAYVPLDVWLVGGVSWGPRALYILGSANILVGIFIMLGYRQLLISTFDATYATTLGLVTWAWQYGLMGMVSLSAVAAFEVVGAILVVAFLVVPPACAYLITKRVPIMLGVAVGIGVLSVSMGYLWTLYFNGSIAGAMACAAGVLFAFVLVGKKITEQWRAKNLSKK